VLQLKEANKKGLTYPKKIENPTQIYQHPWQKKRALAFDG
jgi:hypothetical protein